MTYLVTLGVTVTRPSIRLVTNPPLVVVVKSHTYLPSVKAAVTVSVSVIEQVPSVPLTIAVVNDVADVVNETIEFQGDGDLKYVDVQIIDS